MAAGINPETVHCSRRAWSIPEAVRVAAGVRPKVVRVAVRITIEVDQLQFLNL